MSASLPKSAPQPKRKPTKNPDAASPNPAARLLNVERSLGSDERRVHVLRGVSLTLNRGETAALTGASGAGKSTLASVLGGLEPPDKGLVEINGQNLHSLSETALAQFRARHVGVVFQAFHLLPALNALENVAVPLEILGEHNAAKRAASLLDDVGLSARARHRPHEMSGGEQQRVAVARAIANRPTLLIADEPTGNLDEHTALDVMNLLFSMTEQYNVAALIITHEPELAQRCDALFTMHEGLVSSSS